VAEWKKPKTPVILAEAPLVLVYESKTWFCYITSIPILALTACLCYTRIFYLTSTGRLCFGTNFYFQVRDLIFRLERKAYFPEICFWEVEQYIFGVITTQI
jgi:hypothetical protein